MKWINKISHLFSTKQYLSYLLLFIIAVSLFSYIGSKNTFADPDAFYHAKMAEILAQRGAITQFPWLSVTALKYNFVDHHFLYHLALIPFVEIFSPLVGLKLASIFFSALAIIYIFWFLNQLKIKGAFWYCLFLLTINPFIFRLNLAKAQPLVLILLFLFIYLMFSRRYLGLILVSSLYVWLYAGWPLALALVLLYVILNWFWPATKRSWLVFAQSKTKTLKQNFFLIFSVGVGILAGIFFSPYFPGNLAFYWQQSFKIAVVNYQSVIGVGGEWYPYPPADLFLAAIPFCLLFVFALLVFIIFSKRQSMPAWFFMILSLIFLILTFKSRRYVEYFIPIALCFSALSINVFILATAKDWAKLMPKNYFPLIPIIILLIFSPVFYHDIRSVKISYDNGLTFDKFAEPAQWLAQNSSAGDIVFHTDWDEFPMLFYNNDKDYYLVGLDPTFMYSYDKNLYQRWLDIVTGQTSNDLYATIKEVFGARYVFVDIHDNQIFDRNLQNNFNFEKVFENSEARIYQVLN